MDTVNTRALAQAMTVHPRWLCGLVAQRVVTDLRVDRRKGLPLFYGLDEVGQAVIAQELRRLTCNYCIIREVVDRYDENPGNRHTIYSIGGPVQIRVIPERVRLFAASVFDKAHQIQYGTPSVYYREKYADTERGGNRPAVLH